MLIGGSNSHRCAQAQPRVLPRGLSLFQQLLSGRATKMETRVTIGESIGAFVMDNYLLPLR